MPVAEAERPLQAFERAIGHAQEGVATRQVVAGNGPLGPEPDEPQIGSYSPDEVQAQWLVRSYFEVAAAGADRAAMYMLRDVDQKDVTQF